MLLCMIVIYSSTYKPANKPANVIWKMIKDTDQQGIELCSKPKMQHASVLCEHAREKSVT